jgi:hypothetical protein
MRPGPSRLRRVLRVLAVCALGAAVGEPAAASPPRPSTSAKAPKKKGKKKKGPKAGGTVKTVAKKTPPPPPPPLEGTSYDYDYDGRDVGHPERRWMGRAFVHKKAAALTGQALPVLVFLHGNNGDAIKYRWMGGGAEGDVRRIAAELMEAGAVAPMVVAAPSSIDPYTMTNAGASWPSFDLDLFLDRTEERLGAAAVLDRGRVVVAAHSGGGCNIHGGLNSAAHAKRTPVLAAMSIDTCMLLDLATALAHLKPTTHVIVSWQQVSWPEREFGAFKAVFLKEVKKAPPNPGVLRELDYQEPGVPAPHDALVGTSLKKWLPHLFPPPPAPPAPPPAADAGAPAPASVTAADAGLPRDGGAP